MFSGIWYTFRHEMYFSDAIIKYLLNGVICQVNELDRGPPATMKMPPQTLSYLLWAWSASQHTHTSNNSKPIIISMLLGAV